MTSPEAAGPDVGPVYRVIARNAAGRSENRIHDDSVARLHGFRGGLVPGVTLYAYLVHPVLERYGRDWLERGGISVRFRQPVYEGSTVEARAEAGGAGGAGADGLRLSLRDEGGTECVSGWAGLQGPGSAGVSDWQPRLDLEVGTLPEARPEADERSLRPGRVLGTLWEESDSQRYGSYLELLGADLGPCAEERLVHPGRLILSANTVLAENVRLGPWVHVATELVNLAVAPEPCVIETRAQVDRRYERNGRPLVSLDVLWLVQDVPVAAARHDAIYRLRSSVSQSLRRWTWCTAWSVPFTEPGGARSRVGRMFSSRLTALMLDQISRAVARASCGPRAAKRWKYERSSRNTVSIRVRKRSTYHRSMSRRSAST